MAMMRQRYEVHNKVISIPVLSYLLPSSPLPEMREGTRRREGDKRELLQEEVPV
jgi:hypothetical protein